MKKKIILAGILLLTLVFTACQPKSDNQSHQSTTTVDTDPLPSWNDVKSKKAIMAYVQEVTDKNSLI